MVYPFFHYYGSLMCMFTPVFTTITIISFSQTFMIFWCYCYCCNLMHLIFWKLMVVMEKKLPKKRKILRFFFSSLDNSVLVSIENQSKRHKFFRNIYRLCGFNAVSIFIFYVLCFFVSNIDFFISFSLGMLSERV